LARDALRQAYGLVASLMPEGLPRYPFADHQIEIWPPLAHAEALDGGSLGLPLALAFASLWLNRSLPPDLAATGRLGIEEGRGVILPVGRLEAKAQALDAQSGGAQLRLMFGSRHLDSSFDEGHPHLADGLRERLNLIPVEWLAAALEGAGLKPESNAAGRFASYLGTVAERLERLETLVRDVELQQLDAYRHIPGIEPWNVMGDQLGVLLTSLEGVHGVEATLIIKARTMAALAYTHAGDIDAAAAALRPIEASDELPPVLHALSLIVELGLQLDQQNWQKCHALSEQLEEMCRSMPASESAMIRGRALGARGRALLHQRQLAPAILLLQQAVEDHQQHLPREVGRSRCYLAMAYREAGELEKALETLARAAQDLDHFTKPYSSQYYRTSRLYWRYERARTLCCLGRYQEAIEDATEALDDASWRGWWPQIGIMRTLAEAYRRAGQTEKASQWVHAMERLSAKVPPDGQALAQALVSEARGGGETRGEVY
jgi:tetratricopeptide (TPR) repeat protein